MLGLRFLEHAKQPLGLEFVLLLAVDDNGVVGAGRPESIARVGIRRVDKTSGIDNQRAAAIVKFKRQQIVVLVVAEAVGADLAVGDQQILAAILGDGQAGIRKQMARPAASRSATSMARTSPTTPLPNRPTRRRRATTAAR